MTGIWKEEPYKATKIICWCCIYIFALILIAKLITQPSSEAGSESPPPNYAPLPASTFEISGCDTPDIILLGCDAPDIVIKIKGSFNDLLDAIEYVESGGDANAVGNNGKAIGAYQLKKIYVDDCNRILDIYNDDDRRFTYADRWDKKKSRIITSIVTTYYAGEDWKDKPHSRMDFFETAARTHKNPTERNQESTKAYWLKVKERLAK